MFHWEVAAKVFVTFVCFSRELQVDDNAQSLLLLFFILPKCFLLLLVAMGGVNAVQPGQISPCIIMFLLYILKYASPQGKPHRKACPGFCRKSIMV